MSRSFLAVIAGVLFSLTLAAQPVLTVTGVNANPGETVELDVTVDDYVDYITLQFSMNWDNEVANLIEIKNVTDQLPGFSAASSINPNPGAGILTVSWFEQNITPTTVPDGTVLFTLEFEVVGEECDSTGVDITGEPLSIEIADEDEMNVGATVVNGFVNIPGEDCMPPSDGLTITGQTLIADQGSEVCVQFTATGFTGVAAAQFTLNFNPNVLEFSSIENVNWPGATAGGNFGTTMASNGTITFVWFDQNAMGVDLPDGTVLFEICFNAIGSGGSMSTISFGNDPRPIEFADVNGVEIPFTGEPGRVTVEGQIQGFAIFPEDGLTGPQGGIVCMPITVQDFNNIISLQFSINWDPTVMDFDRVESFGLPDFSSGNVAGPDAPNNEPGEATVLWFDQNVTGVTVPDGTVLFNICFELIGECDDISTVSITDEPLDIEVSDDQGIVDVASTTGSVQITCGDCVATVDEVVPPSCPGDEDGSIDITVIGCPSPVTYLWSNNETTEDLENIGAGTYSVTVTTGDGEEIILEDIILSDPDPITVSATITDVQAGGDGAITLTVDGGTPGYTYLWSTGDTTKDISGLDAGEYQVTITDSRGCELVGGPYRVGDGAAIDGDVTNVACNGESTGAITLTSVNCGGEPYTYLWSNDATTRDITGLSAGTYSVTVTGSDGSTCENTFTVTEPDQPIVISADTTNETSAGNDGAIDLMVSGGVTPYTYAWSNGATTQDISGLSAGAYTVTVTDFVGCEIIETIIIRGVELFAEINQIVDYGGFGVSCFGECDGELMVTVVNAIGDITYDWNDDENSSINTDLCAGQYTVTVTDESGQTAVASYILSEPSRVNIEVEVDCASEAGTSDGSAQAIVDGGVPPYLYQWSTGEQTSSIDGKEPGPIVLLVEDSNGCINMEQTEICISGIDCYEASTVMTPNDDGKNDEFRIQCIFDLPNRLTIYNRFGGMEFRMDNYDNSWQGTDNSGNALSDGGYHWVLEVFLSTGEQRVFQGTVNIVRSLD